jgi:hypothetical protein
VLFYLKNWLVEGMPSTPPYRMAMRSQEIEIVQRLVALYNVRN